MKTKMYRQGDVLLREVSSIPKTAIPQKQAGRLVLAYGEVTGHAHAIQDLGNVDVFVGAEGQLYLHVKEATALQHEEHGTILLPAGKYERVLQREYQPDEIRNVQD